MPLRSVFIVSLIFLSSFLYGQDTLLLMNGQQLVCHITSDTGTVITMDVTKKNGRVKSREIHKSDVFSVTKAGGQEVILYTQNEMFGDIFTTEEMRFYLAGEADARANYKATHILVIGLVACGAIAYIGGDGYFTTVVPPVAYTLAQLLGNIRIREETMSDKQYKYNEMYAYGYEPPARSRRLIRAMEGGLIGSALGVTLWYLIGKK